VRLIAGCYTADMVLYPSLSLGGSSIEWDVLVFGNY
jgi:hypothetical protein